MGYVIDYKRSRYMEDLELMNVVDTMLGMNAGETLRIQFPGSQEASSMRYKIYSILHGLERKDDFKVKKAGEAALDVHRRIIKSCITEITVMGATESIKREEQ